MRIIFLLFTLAITVSSCNKQFKETVGISTPGPNEYQVQRNKALEVPPHYYLPNPQSQDLKNYAEEQNLNDGEKALLQELGD